MKFHIWYLKENGWVERLDTGQYAITAGGVDKVMEEGVPRSSDPARLPREAGHTDEAENGRTSAATPSREFTTE